MLDLFSFQDVCFTFRFRKVVTKDFNIPEDHQTTKSIEVPRNWKRPGFMKTKAYSMSKFKVNRSLAKWASVPGQKFF